MKNRLILISSILGLGVAGLASSLAISNKNESEVKATGSYIELLIDERIHADLGESLDILFTLNEPNLFSEIRLEYFVIEEGTGSKLNTWATLAPTADKVDYKFTITNFAEQSVTFFVRGYNGNNLVDTTDQFVVIWGNPKYTVTVDNGSHADNIVINDVPAGTTLSHFYALYLQDIKLKNDKEYCVSFGPYAEEELSDEEKPYYGSAIHYKWLDDASTTIYSNRRYYSYWLPNPEYYAKFTDIYNYDFDLTEPLNQHNNVIDIDLNYTSYMVFSDHMQAGIKVEATPFVNVDNPADSHEVSCYQNIRTAVDGTFNGKTFGLYQCLQGEYLFTSFYGKDSPFIYIDDLGELETLKPFSSLIKDKIVLVNRGGLTFVEKTFNVQSYGAIGAIVINHTDDFLVANFAPGEDEPISIPFSTSDLALKDYIKSNYEEKTLGEIKYYEGNMSFGNEEYDDGQDFSTPHKSYLSSLYEYGDTLSFKTKIKNVSTMDLNATYEATFKYYESYFDADDRRIGDEKLVFETKVRINDKKTYKLTLNLSEAGLDPYEVTSSYGQFDLDDLYDKVPAIPGYEFVGYSYEKNGKKIDNRFICLTEDTILYPIYEKYNFTQKVGFVSRSIVTLNNEEDALRGFVNFYFFGFDVYENDEVIYTTGLGGPSKYISAVIRDLEAGPHHLKIRFYLDSRDETKYYDLETDVDVAAANKKVRVDFDLGEIEGYIPSYMAYADINLPEFNFEAPAGMSFVGWEYQGQVYAAGSVIRFNNIEETSITIRPRLVDESISTSIPVISDSGGGGSTGAGSGNAINIGLIVGLAVGGALLLGLAAFAVYWFIVKKNSFADLKNVFKKKEKTEEPVVEEPKEEEKVAEEPKEEEPSSEDSKKEE